MTSKTAPASSAAIAQNTRSHFRRVTRSLSWSTISIYDARRQAGVARIAVIGDFNDTPDSAPLAPLLAEGSDIRDVSAHQNFQGDGRPGTFGNGTKSDKIDYILLSPELFARVTRAGVFRKGVWGGVNGTLFEHYPDMTKAVHAASDHAAIFVDLDV